jgi:transposase
LWEQRERRYAAVYLGLDVHLKTISYCVMDATGAINTEGAVAAEVEQVIRLGRLHDVTDATLEACGNWQPYYDALLSLGVRTALAHPNRVRAIASARIKTDAIDARTLAHLLRADLIPEAWAPPPALRGVRELLSYRSAVMGTRVRLKNQIRATFVKEGLRPLKTLFGPTGRGWLDRNEALLTPVRRFIVQTARRQLSECDGVLVQVDEALARHRTGGAVELLQTIPGFGPLTAQAFLAAIGDWSRFPSPDHLASYLGLVPSIRASGGRERRGHITKEGPGYVRWLLVQGAWTAVRTSRYFRSVFHRISRRRGRQIAIVAIAHKLSRIAYAMLTTGTLYQHPAEGMTPVMGKGVTPRQA